MAYNERSNNNSEVTFEILEHIGVLSKNGNGWNKEVNIVTWNGGEPKVDIRDWDPSHERMSRGITLKPEEGEKLVESLGRALSERQNEMKKGEPHYER